MAKSNLVQVTIGEDGRYYLFFDGQELLNTPTKISMERAMLWVATLFERAAKEFEEVQDDI